MKKYFKFHQKYSFLFNREISAKVGQTENLNVEFGYAYRYTNFTINTFYVSLLEPTNGNGASLENKEHEVRIYRFWAFDTTNNVPFESAYFLKMVQIINFNNPVLTKSTKLHAFPRKSDPYPKDNFGQIADYLIHSE